MPFLLYSALNLPQYDACVLASGCPVPYALSDYLFAVQGDRWGAWVWVDEDEQYRAVMPIPRFRKWGLLPYVAMPPLVQRLGVFARPGMELNSQEIHPAWKGIKRGNARVHYSFWQAVEGIATRPLPNLILPLTDGYEAIAAQYSRGLKDNLRKGRGLSIKPTNGGGITWRLFKENVAPRLPAWKEAHNRAWVRLYFQPSEHYRFLHLGAFKNEASTMPEAAATFALYRNRMIYLMGASTPVGRDMGAMARLIDQVVRNNAATGFILDFEGGAMAGTGQFFRSFGAEDEVYFVK